MIRNALLACIAATLLLSCTKTITKEKYIDAMAALGCKSTMEGTPGATAILKEQGITTEDIKMFRQKMDPKIAAGVATEISKKVGACHGITQ